MAKNQVLKLLLYQKITLTANFFNPDLGTTYYINALPGHIVKKDINTGKYFKVSLSPYLKNNMYPAVEVLSNQPPLYSSVVTNGASINGSYMIAGISASADEVIELNLTPAVTTRALDTSLATDALAKDLASIDPESLKNYWIVNGATLVTVNYKVSKSAKFDANVNASYVSVAGKVYTSDFKTSNNRVILLSLTNLGEWDLFLKKQKEEHSKINS